jgi:cyclase
LKLPAAGVPSDTFLEERRRTFHNGDAIEMLWQPNAITDGDSILHFRQADVIVAGDLFTTTQFPVIDVENGGTVQGEIKALNDILNRTVYQHEGEGGTIVVPGHGYVSDEHEVVEYRDMVAIIRDRVLAMIAKGATLEQVKAARPTADYDTRYGATIGTWTTDKFIEAVFKDLSRRK